MPDSPVGIFGLLAKNHSIKLTEPGRDQRLLAVGSCVLLHSKCLPLLVSSEQRAFLAQATASWGPASPELRLGGWSRSRSPWYPYGGRSLRPENSRMALPGSSTGTVAWNGHWDRRTQHWQLDLCTVPQPPPPYTRVIHHVLSRVQCQVPGEETDKPADGKTVTPNLEGRI